MTYCVISRCTFICIILLCFGTTNDGDIGVVMFPRSPLRIEWIQLKRGKLPFIVLRLYGIERDRGRGFRRQTFVNRVHTYLHGRRMKRVSCRVIV